MVQHASIQQSRKSLEEAGINQAISSVLLKEASSVIKAAENLPTNTWELVDQTLNTTGKVIFSGIGKSGLVGQKLAATWSSLGISAFYVHPSDALHGDLGAIQKNDFFIALSKSGTGSEFEYILPILNSLGIKTCLLCCSPGILADKADLVITLPFESEACDLNLAPTSSSTLTMAFGDAVAIVVSRLKGFSKQEFARYHPAGALGKKLLLTVRSLMYGVHALPLIAPSTIFKDLLCTITSKKLGVGIVVDDQLSLLGIISDGDLRRACEIGPEVFHKTAGDIAKKNPKTITAETLAFVALEVMEDFNITSLVVIENKRVVGLLHIHDLIKAGIGT